MFVGQTIRTFYGFYINLQIWKCVKKFVIEICNWQAILQIERGALACAAKNFQFVIGEIELFLERYLIHLRWFGSKCLLSLQKG